MCQVATAAVPSARQSFLAGLGAAWYEYIPLVPTEREVDPCAAEPPWCAYTPFSDFITECQPIDVEYCSRRTVGPGMSPESRAQLEQEWARVDQRYKELNPQGWQAYQDWLGDKWFYQLDTAEYAKAARWTGYAFVGAALLAAFIIAKR